MKKIIPLIMAIGISLCNISCMEGGEDQSPVYGIASWFTTDSINGGEFRSFTIKAYATKGTLKDISFSTFDSQEGYKQLETIEISGTEYKCEYIFKAPILAEEVSNVQLRVRIRTNEGETWQGTKTWKVFTSDFPLKEATGITLYEKPAIGHNNALNLMGGGLQPINTTIEKFDSIKNVVTYYDPEGGDAMSLGFLTESQTENANIYMGKATNYNYAEATYKSALSAYQNTATLSRSVSDLKEDDIILVGLISSTAIKTPLAVIRIVRIIDEEGKDNDRYEINVKTMQRQK